MRNCEVETLLLLTMKMVLIALNCFKALHSLEGSEFVLIQLQTRV